MNTKTLGKMIQTHLSTVDNSFLMRMIFSITLLLTSYWTSANNNCTRTSIAAIRACQNQVRDDYWIAIGNCLNLPSRIQQRECRRETWQTRREARDECFEQFDAREEVCDALGQDPYDPDIDPDNFPYADGIIPNPNPYWPLVPGTTFVYEGGDEVITVAVTHELKEILGVTCIVVHDVVEEDGEVIEDTFDWYAQDANGNVWYFGELSREFEEGELTGISGSWKAGVNGAKPGIIMKADPKVGDVYRQEFFLGEAEDMGEVLALNGSADVVAEGADCDGDCLVTADFTPIEPGALEHKYYKHGLGFILETKPGTDERVELVEIIVDDDDDGEDD